MSEQQGRICTIYKGRKRDELYLFVDRQQGLECVDETLLDSMGELTEVMTLRITPERKLARVEARDVLESLASHGFFVQMPPTLYPEAEARDE